MYGFAECLSIHNLPWEQFIILRQTVGTIIVAHDVNASNFKSSIIYWFCTFYTRNNLVAYQTERNTRLRWLNPQMTYLWRPLLALDWISSATLTSDRRITFSGPTFPSVCTNPTSASPSRHWALKVQHLSSAIIKSCKWDKGASRYDVLFGWGKGVMEKRT